MYRWWWLVAVLGVGVVVVNGFQRGKQSSLDCGAEVGRRILEEMRLEVGGLAVLEGCDAEYIDLRSEHVKSVVVRGSATDVESALATFGVSPDRVHTSHGSHTIQHPPSYAADGVSPGSRWSVEWVRTAEDEYDQGRVWDRSILWGPDAAGDGYVLMVAMEAGSV